MRVVLAESLLHQPDLYARNALTDRLGVSVELETALPRVVTVLTGHHLQKKCIVGDSRSKRSGMIDRRIHSHNAGIGNEAPCRLDTYDARKRCRNPDRTGLVAARCHIDLTEGDQRAGARR